MTTLAPHLRRVRRPSGRIVSIRPAPERAREETPAPIERRKILVGGIPRGGTTMTVGLIGDAPDVFHWPGETSALALARQLWEGGRPNPACREQIAAYLNESFHASLVEMQDFNAKEMNGDPLAASAQHVEALTQEVVDSVIEAASMRSALLAASAAMERFVARFTDRAIIAEKTPSNLFSYLHLSHEARTQWVLCHREPFAVIASVQARAGNDPYAAGWDSAVEFAIGLYLRHAELILRAMRADDGPVIAQYETVNANPDAFMRRLRDRMGEPYQPVNANFVRTVSDRDAWKKFSLLDRWKILRLTSPVRQLLGYDDAYYGADEATMLEGFEPPRDFIAEPLYGMHPADGGTSGRWMGDEAAFAIHAPHGVNKVSARFFNPASMELGVQRVIARDGAKRRIAEITLAPEKMAAIVVDLNTITPAAVTPHGRLYRIEVQPERRRLPVASVVGNLDRRLVSCFATPWTPHEG